MGWSLGYDDTWRRDIGYGVPAYCDHPGCTAEIHRGLAYVCCGSEPYGGEHGCGRYFCPAHEAVVYDEDEDGEEGDEPRCGHRDQEHISPDHPEWVLHKLTDSSWEPWRRANPEEVARLEQVHYWRLMGFWMTGGGMP